MSHDPETIPGDRTLDRMKRKVESGRPALLYKIASLGRRVRISPPEGERDAVMIYTTAEEGERVVRVLQRYARGIIFHETGVPLPLAASIRVAKLPPPEAASAGDRALNIEAFHPLLSAVDIAPERRIGGDVFMYKVRPVTDGGAVLYFCFNGAVEFLLIAEAP